MGIPQPISLLRPLRPFQLSSLLDISDCHLRCVRRSKILTDVLAKHRLRSCGSDGTRRT